MPYILSYWHHHYTNHRYDCVSDFCDEYGDTMKNVAVEDYNKGLCYITKHQNVKHLLDKWLWWCCDKNIIPGSQLQQPLAKPG
jgi:hypothetical protein